MSLRIPLSPDQTLQTEFHEIERRLRKLEKRTGTTAGNTTIQVLGGGTSGAPNLTSILNRLDALEAALASIPDPDDFEISVFGAVGPSSATGIVPAPGVPLPPTGVAQHLLTENATWGFPLRGLIGVSTSGTQTDPPSDVVTLEAGLHAQDLTASDIECFNLHTHGDIEYCDSFFEDLRIEPVARTTGTGAPAFEKWFDDGPGSSVGVYLYSLTDESVVGNEKSLFFSMQMPHGWKLGSPIHVHVHWVGSIDDTTADPRFGLEYAFKDIGEVFGDTVIVYSNGTHTDGAALDPDVTAGKHYITELPDITPSTDANNVSAILIGRLFRNSSSASDTYDVATNKIGVLYIDAHYETDSPGSSSEYVK